MVPLECLEDDIMWVISKLSGAPGDLGAESIELITWFIRFGYTSEELRVAVANMDD